MVVIVGVKTLRIICLTRENWIRWGFCCLIVFTKLVIRSCLIIKVFIVFSCICWDLWSNFRHVCSVLVKEQRQVWFVQQIVSFLWSYHLKGVEYIMTMHGYQKWCICFWQHVMKEATNWTLQYLTREVMIVLSLFEMGPMMSQARLCQMIGRRSWRHVEG